MKIVINVSYGGFGLSEKAVELYETLAGMPTDEHLKHTGFLGRDDPILIQVVEQLGKLAEDALAELKIVEIPNGIEWQIEEYDGKEWVAECHRTWS